YRWNAKIRPTDHARSGRLGPDVGARRTPFRARRLHVSSHNGPYTHYPPPLTSKLLTPVLLDARTNAVAARGEMPWYVTTLLLSEPLRFGDYGGLPLKILWAVLDVIAIVVLGSGVYLWLAKRSVAAPARAPQAVPAAAFTAERS